MKLALLTTLVTATLFSAATYASDNNKTYSVNFTDKAPVIDGQLDTNIWDKAENLTDFTFPWRKVAPPKTEFKALWDQDALYFIYTVTDKNVAIGTDPERVILDSDRVEIFLAKDTALSHYYTMEIDPKGRVFSAKASFDMKTQKRASLDSQWRWPGLETKAVLTDMGYQVEGKLPLATLSQLELWQDKSQSELLCALMRAEFTQQDGQLDMGWMTWVDPKTPKPNFHNPQTFGSCKLVK
ncbi:TPA: carbohydrate-binding family 9-like protein [Photobacterium damselae]